MANKMNENHEQSSEYFEMHDFQASTPVVKHLGMKSDCGFIHETKSEKKMLKKITFKFENSSLPMDSRNPADNRDVMSSQRHFENINTQQDPSLITNQLIKSDYQSALAGAASRDMLFSNRTTSFDKQDTVNVSSEFCSTSLSELSPGELKEIVSKESKEKFITKKQLKEETRAKVSSLDTLSLAENNFIPGPKHATLIPMKITSFNADVVSQEYIFIDTLQFPKVGLLEDCALKAISNPVSEKSLLPEDLFYLKSLSEMEQHKLVHGDMKAKKANDQDLKTNTNSIEDDKNIKTVSSTGCEKASVARKVFARQASKENHNKSSLSVQTSPLPKKSKLKTPRISIQRRKIIQPGNPFENVTTVQTDKKYQSTKFDLHGKSGGKESEGQNGYSVPPIQSHQTVSPTVHFAPTVTVMEKVEGARDSTKGNVNSSTFKGYRKASGNDEERWEELDTKNRRRSETIINTYQEEDKNDDQYGYGSLDRVRLCHQTDSNKEQTDSPHRPTARRSAVVASLPDSDLSVLSDTIASLQRTQPLPSQQKQSKWNFPKLSFGSKDKERSRGQKLEDVLENWKSSKKDEALDTKLKELKNCKGDQKWGNHKIQSGSLPNSTANENTKERKRHNAVWELFTSERTYLIHHLLVLRQVFMKPLQDLQCEGYLLSVDVRSLFGNLEELCEVSMNFCHALLKVVDDNNRSSQFGSADAIDAAFETFGSTMCPPYQRYFSGYRTSLSDREDLKSNEDYILFLEWCERNPRCQRLKLSDFLVTPMQHLTKFPLLLQNIAKYTDDKSQTKSIEETLLEVQDSLKELEGKVSWLSHFQFLQDLQGSILWPPVYELDNKTVLPESLRHTLTVQPCKNLIANPKRQLVMEGALAVVENGKASDVYAFLFDDMLLLTKPKKGKRKSSEIPPSLKHHALLKDGTLLSVHRQPIALDRFMLYDVESDQASAMGLKKAFVLVQENRFQQMCSIVMLQANSEDNKRTWLDSLASTAAQWMEKNVYNTPPDNDSLALKSPLNKSFSTTAIDNKQRVPPLHKLSSTRYHTGLSSNSVQEEANNLSNSVESGSSRRSSSVSENKDDDESEDEQSDYL